MPKGAVERPVGRCIEPVPHPRAEIREQIRGDFPSCREQRPLENVPSASVALSSSFLDCIVRCEEGF